MLLHIKIIDILSLSIYEIAATNTKENVVLKDQSY